MGIIFLLLGIGWGIIYKLPYFWAVGPVRKAIVDGFGLSGVIFNLALAAILIARDFK